MDKYADLLAKIDQFEALAKGDYASNFRVWGPYLNSGKGGKSGRQLVIVMDRKGKRRTLSYPRWIMECRMGRPLKADETVDHKNYDVADNSDGNLQLLPRSEHSALDTRRVKLIKLKCLQCGKPIERSPRLLRDKSKKGKTGPFCGRSCAGQYSRKVQLGQIDKLPVQPYIESEYYRRKNVKAFVDFLIQKYGAPQETFTEAQKRLLYGLKELGWKIDGSKATSPTGDEITIHTRLRFPITLYGGRALDYERHLPVEVGDLRETSLDQLVSAVNDLRLREDRLRWQTMT